jgi:hypothetical protein
LASAPGPGRVQRRGLAERSLVFENDHRPFGFGVFLDSGRYNAPICDVARRRPAPAGW